MSAKIKDEEKSQIIKFFNLIYQKSKQTIKNI